MKASRETYSEDELTTSIRNISSCWRTQTLSLPCIKERQIFLSFTRKLYDFYKITDRNFTDLYVNENRFLLKRWSWRIVDEEVAFAEKRGSLFFWKKQRWKTMLFAIFTGKLKILAGFERELYAPYNSKRVKFWRFS